MGTWTRAAAGTLTAAALSIGLLAGAGYADAVNNDAPPPSQFSTTLNNATAYAIDASGAAGAFTTFQEALDALPNPAGDVVFQVGGGFESVDGLIIDLPVNKGITSFRLEALDGSDRTIGKSFLDNYLYANGIPVTIGANVAFEGSVYGGSHNADIEANTSITVEQSGVVKAAYGGGHNGSVTGDTTITVDGTVRSCLVGGGHAETSTGSPNAQADVVGSTSLIVGATGIVGTAGSGGTIIEGWGIAYGAGAAVKDDASTTPTFCQASVSGSASITIEGQIRASYGGGYAAVLDSTTEQATVSANLGGDAKTIFRDTASYTLPNGIDKITAYGGGRARGTTSGLNNLSADVQGGTTIEATEDNSASINQLDEKSFNRLFGGGYAIHPNTHANVDGNTSVVTARPAFWSAAGMAGGGHAEDGGTASVAGHARIEVRTIEGQISSYENANLVIGGGVAQCSSANENISTATTGSTEVVILKGANLVSGSAISANVVGGGYAMGGYFNVEVSGATSVVVEDGAVIQQDVIGGGSAYAYGASTSGGTESSADVRDTRIQIGSGCTIQRNVIGGGEIPAIPNSHANAANVKITVGSNSKISGYLIGGGKVTGGVNVQANTADIQTSLGDNCTINGYLVGGGFINGSSIEGASADAGSISTSSGSGLDLPSYLIGGGTVMSSPQSHANAKAVETSIGENSNLKGFTIGGGFVYNTTASAKVLGDVKTSIGSGSTLKGNFTIGGGLTWKATDSSVDVGGNISTAFGNNVTSYSYIGGGTAYNGSTRCNANVAGSVETTFGNGYAMPLGQFIGAGYVFYNSTGNNANCGSARTVMGDNADQESNPVTAAGRIHSNSSGSVRVFGDTGSSNAVTFEAAPGYTAGLFTGGGYIDASSGNIDSTSSVAIEGNVSSSFSQGTLQNFFGGALVEEAKGEGTINGDISNQFTSFSFPTPTKNMPIGASSGAPVEGNVLTTIKESVLDISIFSASEWENSNPIIGGVNGATVNGDAKLTLYNTEVKTGNDCSLYGNTSQGIQGKQIINFVGNSVYYDYLYTNHPKGELVVEIGDELGTSTYLDPNGIYDTGSTPEKPTNIIIHKNATLDLYDSYEDDPTHLSGANNITVEEGATLLINSKATATITGNLLGKGTISLPAGGRIAGDPSKNVGDLDGDLTLKVTGDLSAGQTYFDFSDQSAGSVAFADPDGKFVLITDNSEAGHKKWVLQEQFTVTFEANGGTPVPDPVKVEKGKKITAPTEEPKKEHFTFGGWFSDKECTTAWNFDKQTVNADTTLYAKWVPVHYTVTFDFGNGTQPTTQDVEYGSVAPKPEEPTREGYVFAGWFAEDGEKYDFASPVAKDITLIAQWDIASYAVVFEVNGGTPELQPQTIEYGKKIIQPTEPTLAGRMFGGWYDNSECAGEPWDFENDTVTRNITLYAKWTDGIKVTVEAAEHGTISPSEAQFYTGNPLEYTFTPDYGFQIESVTVNGEQVPFDKITLRDGHVALSPTVETVVSATFVPLETGSTEDIINNLPPIAPGAEPTEEEKNTVFDAKLDYEAMPEEEKQNLDQDHLDRLNEAVVNLPEVSVKVELAISAELGANVTIPEEQEPRFMGAVGKGEIEALKNGDASLLKVVVQIESIEAPDDEAESAELQRALGSNKAGQHFSANVTKQLFAKPTDASPSVMQPIKTLPAPVQLTFGIPKSLLATPDGTSRTFTMARTHQAGDQWEAQLLRDEDAIRDTITVSTEKFSTYTIAYTDTHTVTFMNGSNIYMTVQVDNEKAAVEPADDPSKDGYTFVGWFIDEAADTPYDFATPVTEPLTLHAKWEKDAPPAPVIYTVSFDSAGGSPIESQEIEEGKTATEPQAPTREGYAFDGWFAAGADEAYNFAAPITADVSLHAKWTRLFTVTFDTNGGSAAPATQEVRENEKASGPAAPEKEGFDFAGWFADGTDVAWNFDADLVKQDTVLVAKWTPVEEPQHELHEVAFVTGDGGPTVETQQVKDGECAQEPPEPQRDGYTFAGWFSEPSYSHAWSFDTPVTEPVTLYAKWIEDTPPAPVTFVVAFVANGGYPAPVPQTVIEGEFVEKPADPSLEGYEFAGWFADEALTDACDFATRTIDDDLTLYAKWVAIVVPEPEPEPEPEPGPNPGPSPDASAEPLPAPSDNKQDLPSGSKGNASALAPTGDPLGPTTAIIGIIAVGAIATGCGAAFVRALKRRGSRKA